MQWKAQRPAYVVRTDVFVREVDLGVLDHVNGRRLEVIADGLPLFGRGEGSS